MERVAIIGAGVAGAGVAFSLQSTGNSASVFEKSSTIGGRAATRSMNGCSYDFGANYVKSDDPTAEELITETLDTDGLVDIDAPVWTFSADGTISQGDERDEHKWTYEDGIEQLPQRLLAQTSATIFRDTPVQTIVHEQGRWSLASESGEDLGTFDTLVFTPPAPRSAELIEGMHWDHTLRDELSTAVGDIEYRTIFSVLLHYPFELDLPYYALVNTDREHEIGWVSREECKPNHIPDGESLLVVQMAPDWSARRMNSASASDSDSDSNSEMNALTVAELTADLLDDDRLASPDWTDARNWQHALPDTDPGAELDSNSETSARSRAERHGLYLAGDWLAGDGRIHLALNSGLETGERIDL